MNQCQNPHANCTQPFNCNKKAFYSESLSQECQDQWQPNGKGRKIDTALQQVHFCQAAAHTHIIWHSAQTAAKTEKTANESSITYTFNCCCEYKALFMSSRTEILCVSASIKDSTSCEDLYPCFTQLLVVKLEGKKNLVKLLQEWRENCQSFTILLCRLVEHILSLCIIIFFNVDDNLIELSLPLS